MLNIFRATLCPSPGAHDDSVGYHIGRPVLELLLVGSKVQAGWMSVRTLIHPANVVTNAIAVSS